MKKKLVVAFNFSSYGNIYARRRVEATTHPAAAQAATATSSVSASSASEEDTTAASSSVSASSASEEVSADADQEADKVAALIDAIYVQEK